MTKKLDSMMSRENWIESRVTCWRETHAEKKPIRLDGDISGQPMRGAALAAMQAAVAQLGCKGTYPTHGEPGGQRFLREVAAVKRTRHGADTDSNDVFVISGRREAYRMLMTSLPHDARVLVVRPGDALPELMAVRAGHEVLTFTVEEQSGFLPQLENAPRADVICLEAVNLATGAVISGELLARWVARAEDISALVLLDTSYAVFMEYGIPYSAFWSETARKHVVEVRSLHPVEGFAEAGCAFITTSHQAGAGEGWYAAFCAELSLGVDGVAYPVQRAAAALLETERCGEPVAAWRENAAILAQRLSDAAIPHWRNANAPFFWLRCPQAYTEDACSFFEELLLTDGVVCTPGSLFGAGGEGWFRLSALGDRGAIEIGMKRLCRYFTAGE